MAAHIAIIAQREENTDRGRDLGGLIANSCVADFVGERCIQCMGGFTAKTCFARPIFWFSQIKFIVLTRCHLKVFPVSAMRWGF
jgi:hypothetical protein